MKQTCCALYSFLPKRITVQIPIVCMIVIGVAGCSGGNSVLGPKTKIKFGKAYEASFRVDSVAAALGSYSTFSRGKMKYVFHGTTASIWGKRDQYNIDSKFNPTILNDYFLITESAPVQYGESSVRIDWGFCSVGTLCESIGMNDDSEAFEVVKDGFELEQEVSGGTFVLTMMD